jgi:hypothetical protein
VEPATRDATETPGTDALIIGWGTTEDDELSQNLLQARLKLVDSKVCNQNLVVRRILDQIEGDTGAFLTQGLRMSDDQVLAVAKVMLANAGALITKGMMCAGDPNPPKDAERAVDTCQGDSGGPLFVRGADGKFTQVGIVSWGEGCGLPKVYGHAVSDFAGCCARLCLPCHVGGAGAGPVEPDRCRTGPGCGGTATTGQSGRRFEGDFPAVSHCPGQGAG